MKLPELSIDEIKEKFKNLSPRVRVILVLIGISFLVWFFLGKDISKINQLRTEKSSLQVRLNQEVARYAKARRELGRVQLYKKQFQQMESKISNIKGKLMHRVEIPKILSYLTIDMEEKIAFSLIRFDSVKEEALYDKLPISIQLSCDFLVFLEYIDKIKKTLPLFEIEKLRIKSVEEVPGKINVELQANAFISK